MEFYFLTKCSIHGFLNFMIYFHFSKMDKNKCPKWQNENTFENTKTMEIFQKT